MPITNYEQFKSLEKEAVETIETLPERRFCLDLARQLESEVDQRQITDLDFLTKYRNVLGKLKWIAAPILDDAEFFSLFREYLLEGLDIYNFDDILASKFNLQLGFDVPSTANNILLAIRENMQPIGATPIIVKNETRPAKPVIHNWLIDYLRNSVTENSSELDVSSYLFDNPNAKQLSDDDRTRLGKVISLYNNFRLLSIEAAKEEQAYRAALPQILAEEKQKAFQTKREPLPSPQQPPRLQAQPAPPPQFTRPAPTPQSQPRPQFQPAEPQPKPFTPAATQSVPAIPPASQPNVAPSFPDQSARQKSNSVVAPAPDNFQPQPKTFTRPSSTDIYREQISETDTKKFQPPPSSRPPVPKLEGNIINLKDLEK